MPSEIPGKHENRIRELLDESRNANERYSSAAYNDGVGLGRRLAAIEDALVILAQAIDRDD